MKTFFSYSDIEETKKLFREKALGKYQVFIIGSIVIVFYFSFSFITNNNSTLNGSWIFLKILIIVFLSVISFALFLYVKLIPLLLDLFFKKKVVISTKLEYDTYDVINSSENSSPKCYVKFTNISSGMISTREAPYLLAKGLKANDKVRVEYAFFNGHVLQITKHNDETRDVKVNTKS